MTEERVLKVNDAFKSDSLQSQFNSWSQQRDLLRTTIIEMYADGILFKNWWDEIEHEIKVATLMTALEDLPEHSSFASLINVVCPELLDPKHFLDDNGIKLHYLLKNLVESKENQKEIFDFSLFIDDFDDNGTKPSSAAHDAMKLARSSILLQFGTSIMLLYRSHSTGEISEEKMEHSIHNNNNNNKR